jgi:hypothetical protein
MELRSEAEEHTEGCEVAILLLLLAFGFTEAVVKENRREQLCLFLPFSFINYKNIFFKFTY